MHTLTNSIDSPAAAIAKPAAKAPIWFWTVVAFGLIWNVFGAYQFLGSFLQTKESLMATGMSAEQAALYFSLPSWITVAFAVGVFAGLIGSVLLLMRRTIAVQVYALSLVGYIALFSGDVAYGVFENIPTQLTILIFVVIVAAVLLATAWLARKRAIIA